MAVWEDEAIPPFHFNITFTQCQTNATVAGTGSTPSPLVRITRPLTQNIIFEMASPSSIERHH